MHGIGGGDDDSGGQYADPIAVTVVGRAGTSRQTGDDEGACLQLRGDLFTPTDEGCHDVDIARSSQGQVGNLGVTTAINEVGEAGDPRAVTRDNSNALGQPS